MLPRDNFIVYKVVTPVKTRWNSYLLMFIRAVDLQGPISAMMVYNIDEWNKKIAAIKVARVQRKKPSKAKIPEPPFYIKVGGLTAYDWDVIKQYIVILQPLHEATLKLEVRDRAGRNGAIWEVLPCMEWLMKIFEEAKARTAEAITEDYPD